MYLSLTLRCLASSIIRMLVLVMLLVPLVPSSGVVVSALRFRDTSFSLSYLRSRWSGFPSRLSALLHPGPVPEFSLEGGRRAAPHAPNQIVGDHRRPLEHGKPLLPRLQPRRPPSRRAKATLPNTWIIQRIYEGQSFFNGWNFATYPDPTHGQVLYVSEEWAFRSGMAYVNAANQAVMQVDHWSTLTQGQARNSIRIESQQIFNKGLFILDVEQAPWGCGVWPAWWTVGPNWPQGGEIDIVEGVHDNVHNQIAFHTENGCDLTAPAPGATVDQNSTGWIQSTDCYAYANSNSGCQTVDPSQASYGTEFNVLKGGIFAMMWADDGIRVWFFHRAAIPADLLANAPQPNNWGTPTAYLGGTACDTNKFFYNHSIIFDITFCGDWAGTSYISSGCPGTCSDRIIDPTNFANASWTINSLQVYQSPQVHSGDASHRQRVYGAVWKSLIMTAMIFTFFHLFN